MIDAYTYKSIETLAKSGINDFHIARKHNLDAFEKFGFPVRVNSFIETRRLIESMQVNRFDGYLKEMKGFTDDELNQFVSACCKLLDFQASYYPQSDLIIPADSLMAMFVVYLKLKSLKPDFKSILELGPGTGYLSVFLKMFHDVINYTQVEVCESFYLLQSALNQFLFKYEFAQQAFLNASNIGNYYNPEWSKDLDYRWARYVSVPGVKNQDMEKKCYHYPWWQLGDLNEKKCNFELVVSNANLLEFSLEALYDYLTLINHKLSEDGLFFVQCFGFHANGTTETLWDTLYKCGFAPLFLACGETQHNGTQTTLFRPNGVFINKKHHLFDLYYDKNNYKPRFIVDTPIINDSFFCEHEGKLMYTKDDIIDIVIKQYSDVRS